MNFKQLKNFAPQEGERYIIVENGEPSAVLLSFDDYQKMVYNKDKALTDNPGHKEGSGQDLEMPEIPDFFEEETSPLEEELETSDVPEENLAPENEEDDDEENDEDDDEDNQEEKEALKQELRNELTLDDLPF